MLYEYKKEPFSYKQRLIRRISEIEEYEISFPSPFKKEINSEVFLDLYLPPKLNSLLIILPGLGEGYLQRIILKSFARRLVGKVRAVCILSLPYQAKRYPHLIKENRFLSLDAEQTLDFFQQAVLDTQRTMDLFEDRFSIKDFSLLGVSLGSIISIIATAKDKRIRKLILLLSGGNYFRILWRGFLYFFAKKDCTFRECKENFKLWDRFKLKEFSEIQNLKFPKECFYYEPLIFTQILKEREILMFNAIFDPIVPFNSTIELWKELGKPKIYWFPTEHHSLFIFSHFILSKTKSFLDGSY